MTSIPRLIELLKTYHDESKGAERQDTIEAIKSIVEARKNMRIAKMKEKGTYSETTPEKETKMELTVLVKRLDEAEGGDSSLLELFCQQEYKREECPDSANTTRSRSGGKRKSKKSKKSKKSRKSKKSKKSRKSRKY